MSPNLKIMNKKCVPQVQTNVLGHAAKLGPQTIELQSLNIMEILKLLHHCIIIGCIITVDGNNPSVEFSMVMEDPKMKCLCDPSNN